MSNLIKLKFVALDILGNNSLSWILDTKIHPEAMNLDEIYVNVINPKDIIMAIEYSRRIVQKQLFLFVIIYIKTEYFNIKDPLGELQVLKELDHPKSLV